MAVFKGSGARSGVVGGGLYTGLGGGMYTGADDNPYMSNIPPWHVFVEYLIQHGYKHEAQLILSYLPK